MSEEKKRKRTILMSDTEAPESFKTKVMKKLKALIKPARGGIKGTIGKFSENPPPPVIIKYKLGGVKGTPEPKGFSGKLKSKSRAGFQIKVKF